MSAAGLCLVDGKGEEVVPLRPRCFRKAEDVSLHCTQYCFPPPQIPKSRYMKDDM